MSNRGKPIRVDFFYNSDKSFVKYTDSELMRLLKNEMIYIPINADKKLSKIYVSQHAWERWNTRVNLDIPSKEELVNYLHESLTLGRIKFLNNDFGLLNNDIVFHYYPGVKECKISSFYGRISEFPALAEINSLYRFMDIKTDGIHLDVNKERIKELKIWPIPICNLRYQGSTSHYMFEVYEAENGLIGCLLNSRNNSRYCWKLDDPNVPLSKSTITAIKIFKGTYGVPI